MQTAVHHLAAGEWIQRNSLFEPRLPNTFRSCSGCFKPELLSTLDFIFPLTRLFEFHGSWTLPVLLEYVPWSGALTLKPSSIHHLLG
jgi:hypothetical protein